MQRTERAALEQQIAELQGIARSYRRSMRELQRLRQAMHAGDEIHLALEQYGERIELDTLQLTALNVVTQPLLTELIRAAETHCQERARRAWLRCALLTNRLHDADTTTEIITA